ncbi:MAG TPA: hypothetical protein VN903_37745 [Polyangia bacterium]|nr:hypothetical protein [Polyangia bacterium]
MFLGDLGDLLFGRQRVAVRPGRRADRFVFFGALERVFDRQRGVSFGAIGGALGGTFWRVLDLVALPSLGLMLAALCRHTGEGAHAVCFFKGAARDQPPADVSV